MARLEISHLGNQGEGVALGDDGPIYVPYTLAGETIDAEIIKNRGKLIDVITKSSDRTTPECQYYGVCGGCNLQHQSDAKTLEFKQNLILSALERAELSAESGLKSNIAPTIAAYGNGRRRAKFSAKREGAKIILGFMGAKSHDLIDIDDCLILTPNLRAFIPRLRELCRTLIVGREEVAINITDSLTGIDVDIHGLKPIEKWHRPDLEKLARAASLANIARLTLDTHNAYMQTPPIVKIGGANVEIPPASFLQASQECEDLMGDLVVKWAKGSKRFVDLFCGIGTFALRLKALGEVKAYEVHTPSVFALNRAAKTLAGGHTLTAFSRDLFNVPVAPLELKGIDCVVLDPPRAGAEAQIKQLAKTKIPKIIYVSCDPISFARDTKLLIASGYRLKEVHGFDQFHYSPHVELAALLVK